MSGQFHAEFHVLCTLYKSVVGFVVYILSIVRIVVGGAADYKESI